MSRTLLPVMIASVSVILRGQSPPSAHFTMSAQGQSVNDGQSVTLAAPVNGSVSANFTSTSIVGSAGISSYAWKSNGSAICTSAPSCSVSFSIPNNTVTLTVTDVSGRSSTAGTQVNVVFQKGPAAHFSMMGHGEFKNDGQTLTLNQPASGGAMVNLTSTSTQGDTSILTYVWKSNGNIICSNSPSCNWPFSAASSMVTLSVADSNGQSSTATAQVNVTAKK